MFHSVNFIIFLSSDWNEEIVRRKEEPAFNFIIVRVTKSFDGPIVVNRELTRTAGDS